VKIPEYVLANLDYWLKVEREDPDRAGPVIAAISDRWQI
jgi:hypothetical protein